MLVQLSTAGAGSGLRKPWQSLGTASLVAVRRRRNTLAHSLAPRGIGVRKAIAFRGESGLVRFPLVNHFSKLSFANIPVGCLQRNIFRICLRKN